MLDKFNIRQLAYVVRVGWVRPIEGADNIELIGINGWTCIAKKHEFNEGDLAIYFEIDSKLPEADWSAFMEAKHYKVKTMKLSKFNVVSQGLALPASALGGTCYQDGNGIMYMHFGSDSYFKKNVDYKEGDFLTEALGVTYSVAEDNVRKAANPDARINSALARHPKIAKKFGKYIKKYKLTRILFMTFFGRKRDGANFPAWVVKTDEERVQNMPWILEDKSEWYATEKIDGTSTTFTMRRNGLRKEYLVCSRNVAFDSPAKVDRCFYDSNVYLKISEKYHMRDVLTAMLNADKSLAFVTIQGETYGDGIQRRTYGLKGHDLAVFNVIFGYKNGETRRCNPEEMTERMREFNIPCVPIVDAHFVLPDTVDELLAIATDKSKVDGGMREGLVFRSRDGARSFKAVSNEFLLRFHS